MSLGGYRAKGQIKHCDLLEGFIRNEIQRDDCRGTTLH